MLQTSGTLNLRFASPGLDIPSPDSDLDLNVSLTSDPPTLDPP